MCNVYWIAKVAIQDKTDIKKCKTLNILKIAATDKENLTSGVPKKKKNLNSTKASVAKRNKKNIPLDNRINLKNKTAPSHLTTDDNCNKKDEFTQTGLIIDTDLTVDNPSENYWKNLAESHKKALESTLKENVDLHNKVNELEYEVSRLKSMLNEAKSLVEVLTEMIEEKSEKPNEPAKEENILDDTRGATSDSDIEDMSFQSCL